ncbi:hypothetical protein pb186bvf_004635 [Paramecium bursaria]
MGLVTQHTNNIFQIDLEKIYKIQTNTITIIICISVLIK